MNIMKLESEGKYLVTLENGAEYHEVPCLGAYDSEMEFMRDIFDGTDEKAPGIFNRQSYETGVIFYYTDEKDTSKYVFVKGEGKGTDFIFTDVFLK